MNVKREISKVVAVLAVAVIWMPAMPLYERVEGGNGLSPVGYQGLGW